MLPKITYALGILFLLYFSACTPRVTQKAPSAEPALPQTAQTLRAYVIKETVNVRQASTTGSAIVATLEDGSPVQILENKNGWYHIVMENGKSGWVRSDLVGPRNLSKTIMAAAFNDSIMPNFSAQLFIDKNKPYKVIYLQFEKHPGTKMDLYVKRIVNAYQEKVYRGAVTVHVLRPNSDQFLKSYTFKSRGIAEIPLPVLPAGILQKVELHNNNIKLHIVMNTPATHQTLLKVARKASGRYSYPFEKAEIIIRARPSKQCLLYYVEDAYGEDYYFDRCQPPAS